MSVWVPSEYSSFLLQSKDVRGVVNGCLSLCINPATDWPPVYPPCWLVTAGIGSALRMMLNWIIRRRWMDGWLIRWRIQVSNFICIQLQVICSLISGPLYRRGSHLTSEYFMHNHDCDCILWINWISICSIWEHTERTAKVNYVMPNMNLPWRHVLKNH